MKRNSKEATMLSRHIGKDWRLNELDKVYLEKGFYPAKPSDQPEWVKEVGFWTPICSLDIRELL